MDKLKVGLIGAGRMAGFHLEVLSTFPDVDIKCLVTTPKGKERRKNICTQYNIPSHYSNIDDMLQNEDLDAVFIQPSVQFVFEIAKKCLNANLNTFIEKPPGLTSAENRELLELAEKKQLIEMVGLQRRFYSHILKAKSIIEEQGNLFSIVVEAPERFTQIKSKNKFTDEVLQKWIFANGIHMLDLLIFLGGRIKNITSVSKQWVETMSKDSFHSLIEFESGTVGQYISNWSSPGGWSIKMYGDGVRAEISPVESGKLFWANGDVEDLKIDKEDIDYKPGVYNQNRMFVDACLGKKPISYPAATLKDSLTIMELIEDII